MSFTNMTPNYGLPQWLAADKPKFLTDLNNAFSTIDTQIKNANDTANAAADNATSALSIAGQAATTAEGAATVAGQSAALAQSVNELVGTLNARMGTTSIATIGDGTVTGAIDALNTDKVGYMDVVNDADNFEDGITIVSDSSAVSHLPASQRMSILTFTLLDNPARKVQVAFSETGLVYTRLLSTTWDNWRTLAFTA